MQRYGLRGQSLLDIADARKAGHRDENNALIVDGALQILDLLPDKRRFRIFKVEDCDIAPLQALLERVARRGCPLLSAEIRPVDPGMDRDLALQQPIHNRRVGLAQFASQARRLLARRIEKRGPGFDRLLHPADDVVLVATGKAAERQRQSRDVRPLHRDVIEAEHDILRRHDDRLAVRRAEDVVGRHHQDARFELRFQRQRHMHRHLVAVEIGIECRAHQRVQLDRLALDQHRFEGLDAEAVQRRSAVQQDRMFADHLFEDVPHFRPLLLDHALRRLDRAGEAVELELRVDEWLEELERHLLRQAALMQLQFGADNDDRAARIVDALAQEVLAEAALLAFQHVRERLQRAFVGAGNDPAAPAVIEQRIDGFLQHALLVPHDDVGRAQLDEALQPIVAVDDAAVEVVEVGGGEAAAIERHERAQLGRDDRHDFEDHPFRPAMRLDERLDELQPLHELFAARLGGRIAQLFAEPDLFLLAIDRRQHDAERLGADRGGELVLAVIVLRLQILFLIEQLMQLERRQARLDDDIALEIKDLFEIFQSHVEQQADAARQGLQEPDMRHGRGQLYMAHAVAAYLRQGDLDAALLADDPAVLHALVLAAQALVILDWPENAGAEQAVPLGLEGTIVDRLRLLDLAVGPGADALRAGDRDTDLVEALRPRNLPEDVHQLVHRGPLSNNRSPGSLCTREPGDGTATPPC